MNDSVTNTTTLRTAKVRFCHIDMAGKVFYPRYFELLKQAFPEDAPGKPPFCIDVQFDRPTLLGDTLEITLSQFDSGWVFDAAANGERRFQIRSPATSEPVKPDVEYEDYLSIQRVVGDFEAGPDGRLQVSRYYELVNEAVENWFSQVFQMPFETLKAVDEIGVPTVRHRTDCHALPMVGSDFEMRIRPLRVGKKSLTVETKLAVAGECLITNIQTLVFVKKSGETLTSIRIPEPILNGIEASRLNA